MIQIITLAIIFTVIMHFQKKKLIKTIEKMAADKDYFVKESKKLVRMLKKYTVDKQLSKDQITYEDFQSFNSDFLNYCLDKQKKSLKISYIILGILFLTIVIRMLSML